MDNRRIDVVSDHPEHLRAALSIVARGTIAGFRDYPAEEDPSGRPRTLVLYWHHGPGIVGFPTPLTLDEVVPLVVKWLEALKPEERSQAIDFDGSLAPGFRVFNEEWGHVIDNGYGIAGIQGVHAWYGK